MFFRVANLGPIREAELDLSKELIVLTGPNNTGKTYLTWAVYGLSRLGGFVEPPGFDRWVQEWIDEGGAPRPISQLLALLPELLRSLEEDLAERLPDIFAAGRERFSKTKIRLRASAEDLRRLFPFKGAFTLCFDGELVSLVPVEGAPATVLSVARETTPIRILQWATFGLVEFGASVFPVERLAINLFARELAVQRTALVDEVLDQIVSGSKDSAIHTSVRRRAGRYPRVIRDALQQALKLRSGDVGDFSDLADDIEREVLGGTLSKTEFDEIEFTPAESTDARPLGLHQSASVIKSLASLVWHLRYEAREGERLIIDEPELNLHPDNQRRVARVLAKAVNRGLKVMMSTHSDYVVRELNNLIMLSQDSDAARGLVQEMGIDPLSTIRPDKLGVYLVQGGECRPVPVTDTGFEVKTIDEEIHRLNRDAQTIYSRLFDE